MRSVLGETDGDTDTDWSDAIIIGSTATTADGRSAPVVSIESIDHHGHG